VITPFGLRHSLLVRDLPYDDSVADLRSMLAEPVAPLQAALRGYFFGAHAGVFTYVLRAPGQRITLRGYAQVRAHGSSPAWSLVRMAPALDGSEEAATIWYRLLLHLCIAAGEKGVQRLYARLPADSPAEEVFRQASFAIYTHDQVFARAASTGGGRQSANLRPVQREDTWEMQRLHYRLTPRLVLQMEGADESSSGTEPWEALLPGAEQCHALYSDTGQMLACLCIASATRGAWLRMLVDLDAQSSAAELVDHALFLVGGDPARPLFCAVREYQGGIRAILEERGFQQKGNFSLMVKHTTVRVREPARSLVHALEKRAEIAPTVSRSRYARP
jgi:hypothetical protein